MRKFNFIADPEAANSRKSAPMPYFIPAAPAAAPVAAAAAATTPPSSHMMDTNNRVYSLQQKKLNDDDETMTTQLFNPYYYIAENTWEIHPHECVRIYFDGSSDYYHFESSNHWYNSVKKHKHIFFLLQNNSDTSIIKIPLGTRLLSVLIMPEIQSHIIPAPRSYSFSE